MSKPSHPLITTDCTICQSTDPVAANMDGEVALMSITTGRYYCLNETGSRIWELIGQPRPVSEVCKILQEEYAGIDPQQLEAAVLGHIAELADENLVQVNHAAAA